MTGAQLPNPDGRRSQEVWIVGGTRGLGLAVAECVAAQGCSVVVLGRNEPPHAVPGVRYLPVDAADERSVDQSIGRLFAERGAPAAIVYAAAMALQGSFLEMRMSELGTEIDTNYLGFVRLCRVIAEHKPDTQRLRLVAVASTLGYVGCPSVENYSASKAALICFARAARVEMSRFGVEIVILSPPHMDNGVDLRGPRRFAVAWAAKRFVAALEAGRRERLLGASNRMLTAISRISIDSAQAIMNRIGADALRRKASTRRSPENVLLPSSAEF
jgi:NAD(P)-dependent dehydrogenase (short-subunit alcohol dehydrogenase family)